MFYPYMEVYAWNWLYLSLLAVGMCILMAGIAIEFAKRRIFPIPYWMSIPVMLGILFMLPYGLVLLCVGHVMLSHTAAPLGATFIVAGFNLLVIYLFANTLFNPRTFGIRRR